MCTLHTPLFRGCSQPREPTMAPVGGDFRQVAFGGRMGTRRMGQGLQLCLMKSTESLRLEKTTKLLLLSAAGAAYGKPDVVLMNQRRWGEGRGKIESALTAPILKAEKATFEQIRAPHGARKKALPRYIKICKNDQVSKSYPMVCFMQNMCKVNCDLSFKHSEQYFLQQSRNVAQT